MPPEIKNPTGGWVGRRHVLFRTACSRGLGLGCAPRPRHLADVVNRAKGTLRGTMRPTRRGIAIILAGVVLYLLARQSLVGWFYVANAVVWALVLVNLVLPWWTLRGLKARRRLSSKTQQGIFEGDTVQVDVELANPGLTPRFLFTAVEECPLASPGQRTRSFLVGAVRPRGSITASYVEECYQRGEFLFGPLALESSMPFGLFIARRKVEAPLKVLVYPQVFPFPGVQAMSSPVEGASLVSLARHTGEFRGAREYQPGDSLRSVHWRSSARQGHLMVKEYDRSPENRVTVAFDATKSFGEGKETTMEYSIKLAASIARACYLNATPFSMTPPGPAAHFPGWRAVLDYLARLRHGQGPDLADTTGAGKAEGRMVALVALADRHALDALARIPAARLAAAVVLQGFAPAEERLSDLESLKSRGVPVITCGPGHIPAALEALADTGAWPAHSSSLGHSTAARR